MMRAMNKIVRFFFLSFFFRLRDWITNFSLNLNLSSESVRIISRAFAIDVDVAVVALPRDSRVIFSMRNIIASSDRIAWMSAVFFFSFFSIFFISFRNSQFVCTKEWEFLSESQWISVPHANGWQIIRSGPSAQFVASFAEHLNENVLIEQRKWRTVIWFMRIVYCGIDIGSISGRFYLFRFRFVDCWSGLEWGWRLATLLIR